MHTRQLILLPALAAFALATTVGCGQSEQSEQTGSSAGAVSDEAQIEDVAAEYVQAVDDADVAAALAVTCSDPGARDQTSRTVERAGDESITFVSVSSIEVTGDTAAVVIEFTEDGGDPQTQTSTLVREGGEWLMCDGAN